MLIRQVFPESIVAASTACKYFYRCEQGTGDIENLVAGGALAVKNAGFLDATLWAAAGYATVGANTAYYCTVPASTHDLDHVNNTLVITLRVKKSLVALPAAEQYMIASYNPGSTTGGIILTCRADGAAKLYINTTDNTTVGVTSAASAITSGLAAPEVSIVCIVPRESGSAYIAINGLESSSAPASTIVGKSIAGGNTMRIGGPLSGGLIDGYGIASSAAYQVARDMSAMKRALIYDWALRNPGVPIPDWVFAA